MSEYFLDLREITRVIDFLAEHLEYAPPQSRADAERWIHAYEENEKISREELGRAARIFAWSIWSARYAVGKYFMTTGVEQEWRNVLAAIRPSTAHLLARFRQGTGTRSLDETLAHVEADVAFHEGERREVADVRAHLRQEAWRKRKRVFGALVKEGERLVRAYRERLDVLRELAPDIPRTLQDEIFSKLERYQDRILFEGEAVPLEILDEEAAYYREQKEISPLEG